MKKSILLSILFLGSVSVFEAFGAEDRSSYWGARNMDAILEGERKARIKGYLAGMKAIQSIKDRRLDLDRERVMQPIPLRIFSEEKEMRPGALRWALENVELDK